MKTNLFDHMQLYQVHQTKIFIILPPDSNIYITWQKLIDEKILVRVYTKKCEENSLT